MSAKRSVHHSHQHAASLSTDNTHRTGHPLQNARPRASHRAVLLGIAVGTDPESRSLVYAPPCSFVSAIFICPFFISHLAFAREICLLCQVFGSLIRHAASIARTPITLSVPVICAAFFGRSVFLPRLCIRPLQPLGSARIAAVGVPPIAASMNIKVSAASAACDLVKLRLVLGETKTGLLGKMTRSCPYPLDRCRVTRRAAEAQVRTLHLRPRYENPHLGVPTLSSFRHSKQSTDHAALGEG
jgi:hypothetical protein